jgi:ribosome-associated toxin RatA of RatAB toxin-antitoxin module
MKTSTTITMKADYDRIFALASRVEDWGRILPHYRYVKVLRRDGKRKWVKMSAWRNFIPVTWSAIETVHTGSARRPGTIAFKHIGGLVRGMDVEWSFQVRRDRGDVLVTISHDLKNPPFPVKILGPFLIEKVVGEAFIGHIAGKTLRRIKLLTESGRER